MKALIWTFLIAVVSFNAGAVEIPRQPDKAYDVELSADEIRRHARAWVRFSIMTNQISLRSGIGVESPEALADEYNTRFAEILHQADTSLDRFNIVERLIRGHPKFERIAAEEVNRMDQSLVRKALPPTDFEDVQNVLDGVIDYDLSPDMVPGLNTPSSTTSPASNERLPEGALTPDL